MTIVSISEFKTHLGIKKTMYYKHKNSGILEDCFVPDANQKKIYLEKAIKAVEANKKRDTHNSKNKDSWTVYKGDEAKKKINEVLEELKPKPKPAYKKRPKLSDMQKQDPKVPPDVEDDEDLNNAENLEELETLLMFTKTPIQRVTVIKDFWTGKINEQKFKKEEGELITLTDAKGVVEVMFTPLSRKLDDIHIDLKNRFPDIPMDAVEWLADYVNDIKKSVSEYEW